MEDKERKGFIHNHKLLPTKQTLLLDEITFGFNPLEQIQISAECGEWKTPNE